jgi:PIN domain nuclease of toxin-antitoxin system
MGAPSSAFARFLQTLSARPPAPWPARACPATISAGSGAKRSLRRKSESGRDTAASMTVLDASALIAFMLDEPARSAVDALLRRRPPPSISAVNLAEVIDHLVRVERRSPADVNDSIDLLIVGGLQIEPFRLPHSRRASSVRMTHYDRSTSPLSQADCACLATAIALQTDLATSDPALARAARLDGVTVVALPDSTGRRPE